MNKWKFLLIGITGDLAKRYVIPSLSKFAEKHKDTLQIELIGFSRSKPDLEEITKLLNEATSNGQHNIYKVTDIQGQYDDQTILNKILSELKEDERLVTYFAVPPILIPVLVNSFCLYPGNNVDILIEKPVGQNKTEALEIFSIIDKCNLFSHTHFIDHYLFKDALYINEDQNTLLRPYKEKKIRKIEIRALEEIGVEGRAGYYDENGAIKDFLPSHMVSLLDFTLKTFPQNELKTSIYETFTVKDLQIGQYESYLKDIEKEQSATPSYFKITGSMKCNNHEVEVIMESGKKLGIKKTEISIAFEDNSSLIWKLAPKKEITTPTNEDISLNANSQDAHVNMYDDLLRNDYSRFFIKNMILQGWNIYDKVLAFQKENSVPTVIYKEKSYPIQTVS
jgi:glucose-6-phosphate 1-dehydrogenase